jgi:glycosyltransferase involved in cell wall biosynthesis
MILFLHNRYRTPGGEERVMEDLAWLVREHLHEPVQVLARGFAPGGLPQDGLGNSPRDRVRAGVGLLRGGLAPAEVGEAVRASGARVVHAHNLLPTLGWRALAAARAAGARVVLHLHQYRLVCANGVCFTRGHECTRCHGRNTLPGVLRNCRGSRAEALAYGAGLALWQRRTVEQLDAVVVPSEFARERLRALGAPLPWERVHVLAPVLRTFASASRAGSGAYALVVSRLAPEKGVDVAIAACQRAGVPLVIAGEGPLLSELRRQAGAADVRFVGFAAGTQLAELRRGAALALVPSRSGETFGMAAVEAMAAGVPVAGSGVGALGELLEEEGAAAPGDVAGLARAIERLWGDERAGERGLRRARALCSPDVLAPELERIYSSVQHPTAAGSSAGGRGSAHITT